MRGGLGWRPCAGARSGARRGASRLRRFILENDLLEALIALPEQLFLRILANLKDGDEFERQLDAAAKKTGVKFPAPARRAILPALSETTEQRRAPAAQEGSRVRAGLNRGSPAPYRGGTLKVILDLTLTDRRLACLQVEERMRLQAASGTTSKCGDRCSLPSRRLPCAYDVYILAHEG